MAATATCTPGNRGHYMRKGLPPEMRYNPPQRFEDMLLGKLPTPLEFDSSDTKWVGWVDYPRGLQL